MFVGTVGNPRTGKTVLDNILALITAEDETQEVFANYHINHPRIKYITVDDFFSIKLDDVNSGLALIDEAYTWLESRISSWKEMNRAISKIIFQSGKRGFDILWNAQLGSSVDKRLRLLTMDWFSTRRKLEHPQFKLRYVYANALGVRKFNFSNEQVLRKLVYPTFNTRELIDMKRKAEQSGGVADIPANAKIILDETLSGDNIASEHPEVKEKNIDLSHMQVERIELPLGVTN